MSTYTDALYLCIESLSHDAQVGLPALFVDERSEVILRKYADIDALILRIDDYDYALTNVEVSRHFTPIL